MANVDDIMRQRDRAEAALGEIWRIVHTTDHHADFDKIRAIIKPFSDYFGGWPVPNGQ